jgi:HTH-type transcriptional regulator/antitoxin HigA
MASQLSAYDNLLLEYKPRPIRNQRDHARALRHIDRIMRKGPHLPRAESELVEVLATLIQNYESAEFPTPRVSPAEKLAHLIEVHGVTKAEVAAATGIPRSTITNVIAGRRQLSTANVGKLAQYFNVSPAEFISMPDA